MPRFFDQKLPAYSDYAYALLRIVSGFMFAFHGAQIVLEFFAEGLPQSPIGSQSWFGGWIELLGGLLIAIGWQTRAAAFLCSGTMAVAYFQFHWRLQMNRMVFPTLNLGELSVLYCFIFLLFCCRGAGIWSVDDVFQHKRGTPPPDDCSNTR